MSKGKTKNQSTRAIVIGVLGGTGLLLVYFSILTFANSFSHAVEQFYGMWYWISLLVVGFGIQIGLYFYVKEAMLASMAATTEIAAAGGISAGSMVACCLHHVTDVLPLIGLTAASLFLLKYQIAFMVLGIASNLIGIIMMLNIIQKQDLFRTKSWVSGLFTYDLKQVRNIAIALSVIIVSFAFFNTAAATGNFSKGMETGLTGQLVLPVKTNSENAVTIKAEPVDFSFGKEIRFDISLDTHQGDLNYQLEKISVLEDDRGNRYIPISWEGSPPGGHHRYGTLIFPGVKNGATNIKLTIKGIYEIPERVFSWELK